MPTYLSVDYMPDSTLGAIFASGSRTYKPIITVLDHRFTAYISG